MITIEIIYRAKDGTEFSTEKSCRLYESGKGFSFARNIILDENGKRLLPETESASMRWAVNLACYLEFKTKKDRCAFVSMSRYHADERYQCEYPNDFPADILRFMWFQPLKRFVSISTFRLAVEKADRFLDQYQI